jgi:hypothetical protein
VVGRLSRHMEGAETSAGDATEAAGGLRCHRNGGGRR